MRATVFERERAKDYIDTMYTTELQKTAKIENLEDPKLLAAFEQPSAPRHMPSDVHPSIEPMSERELEVLKLVAAGFKNQEIAEELFVVVGTVKAHLNSIYRKLGVQSRIQAVSRAKELDLLDADT